uniref:Uncharacterized protein n=5 Tax=Pseudomonas TaxID=286 RepID=A0A7G8ACV7_PSEAI|nr:Hypothetical protein [Pseudomonas putida]QNI15876.1 Hypothetical protein [Pseudomonas aeruginosa]QNI16828.1 Hypothetical protein [Pseudomonas aeruginosa]QNI17321.1 Hypothetical protein [Pseudomonas sp.]
MPEPLSEFHRVNLTCIAQTLLYLGRITGDARSWQREAPLIRRLAVMATLTIAAGCSSHATSETPTSLNGQVSAQPTPLTASQARSLAFDDCNYIVDHLASTHKDSARARALNYCMGVDVAKFGMN